MKKATLLFLVLFLAIGTHAQFNNKSKFLYGSAKSKEPFSIGISAGIISSQTFFNTDYQDYNYSFATNIYLEKPINYRFSASFDLRLLGNIKGAEINLPQNEQTFISQGSSYQIRNSFDISGSIKYMFYDGPNGNLSVATGLGMINRITQIKTPSIDTSTTNQVNAIIPITLSGKTAMSKRIDLTVGYRYYLTMTDQLDATILKNNNDKYGFFYIGFYYNIGEKDFRYKKKNTCPTVNQ